LIEELNFTSCKRLKTNKKSQFFVGVTGKREMFIVHLDYFDSNEIFSYKFLANVKKKSNEEHKLTAVMKGKLRKQRLLYSTHYQIVKIAKTTDKKKEIVYKGWSLKQVEVVLDIDWIEENFKIREPDFFNALTNSKEDKVILPVPIGKPRGRLRPNSIQDTLSNDGQEEDDFKPSCKAARSAASDLTFQSSKMPQSSAFKLSAKAPRKSLIPEDSPPVFYQQRETSSCVISSLASAMYYIGDTYGSEYIIRRKQSCLSIMGTGRINFCHNLLIGHYREKKEKRISYSVEEWKESMTFDIFQNVSPYPTVCAIIDSSQGIGHCITVCDKWIFDSNFEWAFPLTQECLNYICKSEDNPDIEFLGVSHAIRATPPYFFKK